MLTNNSRKKNIKVVLKAEHSTNTRGDAVTTTTYSMVPGTVKKSMGVRGGIDYKSNPYLYDSDQIANLVDYGGKMTSAGIHAGLIFKKSVNLVIKDDQFGRSFNSLGTDLYFDVLILPVTKFMDVITPGNGAVTDQTATIKNVLGSSPFGFRLGWKGYQIAPKSSTGKKFGMSYVFEAGMKPYLGWFMNGGIGITILK